MVGAADADQAAALARLYDVDLLDDPGDADLYLALARRTGGPVLELGVGTGRLAVPLARAGYPVVGLDRDPAMLARCRARARAEGIPDEHLALVEGSLPADALVGVGPFRLAFVALNTLLLLDPEAQERTVALIARHLAPGGVAVVDVWLPDGDDLARCDGRLVLEYVRSDPETGRVVAKAVAATFDPVERAIELVAIYDEALPGAPSLRWIRRDRLWLTGPALLARWAGEAGLEVETLAGGYDLGPLTPASERAILVARRP
jgi:SAM-dependent methyltransferase